MCISVGIPCHVDDINLLVNYCLPSILRLKPSPDYVVININRGYSKNGKRNYKAVKIARTKIFNTIFDDLKCDIALMVSVDHYLLSKNILEQVDKDIVTNFGLITNRPISSIFFIITRLISRNPWNACFSIPKKTWYQIKKDWMSGDGNDSTIHFAIKNNYKAIKTPKYMLIRRNQKAIKKMSLYHPYNKKKNVFVRMMLLCKALNV